MYSAIQLGAKYFSYFLNASSGKGHGIHSPFVFDFVQHVLRGKMGQEEFQAIETRRRELLHDRRVLTIQDYGAGSSSSLASRRTVASIAKHAVKPAKYGQLLYRIAKHYKPGTIVELGTSLGLTTTYLSLSSRSSTIFTLEGAQEIAAIARESFHELHLENIELVEGNFDYTLPAVLHRVSSVDMAFIDGNHRMEPTFNYFEWLLARSQNNSIFIFDDIHWSAEMEQAWKKIIAHPAVRCSIDLFFIGVIFFRREFAEKQAFTIRY